MVSGRSKQASKQASKHTHTWVQWSHASVSMVNVTVGNTCVIACHAHNSVFKLTAWGLNIFCVLPIAYRSVCNQEQESWLVKIFLHDHSLPKLLIAWIYKGSNTKTYISLQKKKGCFDSSWLSQFHTSSASLNTVETHCLLSIPNSD